MKQIITIVVFFITANLLAQKPCEYSVDVNDSIGSYKSTREYIVHEKIFGGNSNYIFYSLASTDGMPTLNVQLLQKSKDFLKANCFDKNSKLILQLNNGTIITMLHIDQENCGTMIRDDKGFDNRVNTGNFMFMKGSIEELKKSPISMMRIQYLTGTEDYILKKELKSELDNKTYQPENYFIDHLRCIE